jgi:hypothetical protein
MARTKILERLTRETVVVHTAGASLRGVLGAVHRDCLVLWHAAELDAAGSVSIDGEALVPLERVLWIQRLTASEGD